jgi:hypothetical protein
VDSLGLEIDIEYGSFQNVELIQSSGMVINDKINNCSKALSISFCKIVNEINHFHSN